MCQPAENTIDRLADEILGYLRARPQACDSAEGIARWWIRRQRLEAALCEVHQALDRLVAGAVLEVHGGETGRARFALRADAPPAGTTRPAGATGATGPGGGGH